MTEKFMTATDVAWKLNMKLRTVQQLMAQGKLPGIKVGGQWRVPESELIRWMNEQRPRRDDRDYVW